MADTHTVMPKKLAQALMEAGVKHFDIGGPVVAGNGSSASAPIGGTVGQLLGGDNFSASGANIQNGTNADELNNSYNQAQSGIQAQQGLTSQLTPQAGTAISNQQSLAQQLLNQSNGQGPNPAQAALNASTGTNVANQAALMASQRGASANPALVARNAAMQGANIQQQAVGQSATLQAQQQLAAQQQLQSLSAQQLAQTQGATTAQNAATQGEQTTLQNANTATNNANVGIQSNINNNNAAVSAANAKQGSAIGGLLNGVGGAVSGITSLFAGGGAAGGFSGLAAGGADSADLAGAGLMMAADGGGVPGKAAHPGNDIRNDVVPAMLSKGEVVLPRSVTQSPDAAKKAEEFMKHIQDKSGKKESGYSKVAGAKKTLEERVKHLEKHFKGGPA